VYLGLKVYEVQLCPLTFGHIAQLARASVLQAEGFWFESRYAHKGRRVKLKHSALSQERSLF
jgi:hypothetical protein